MEIPPAPQSPPGEPPVFKGTPAIPPRSPKQQSWGTALAIIIVVILVIVGAFYAWGKRIAEQNNYPATTQQ